MNNEDFEKEYGTMEFNVCVYICVYMCMYIYNRPSIYYIQWA